MNIEKLPEYCYGLRPPTHEIVIIKRGVRGYFPSSFLKVSTQEKVNELNKSMHVTRAQAEAMMYGSMFGWDTPASDPDNYDEEGRYIYFVRKDKLHQCLKLTMRRQGYQFSDISETMTVGELISELRRYPKDLPVVLSLDDGCTIGGLTDEDIAEEDLK